MPKSIIPNNSVFFNLSLKNNNEIKIENINSICPTARTSAAVVNPNATNHPKVAPVPHNPAGKLGFQYLMTAKNSFFLTTKRYIPTNIVWNTIAMNETNKDLSRRGPSIDIIDILKVTTEPASKRPDNNPINVPIEETDDIKSLTVSTMLSAFFA